MNEVSHIKPRLDHGRAGLRCRIKIPIPINKPIVQAMDKKQPKVLVPDTPIMQDKFVPIPNYTTPNLNHRGDTSSKKPYRMLAGKF